MDSLHPIEVKTITGESRPLADFAGKALLIVNVASKCGFTPQYQGLEALHRQYKDRGFAVLGFPCDQFGHQEPGNEEEIRNFCSLTYDVSFPMFAKVEVNGSGAHPLYVHLKKAAPGILGNRGGEMELHQVPGRSSGQGTGTLRSERQAGSPGALHRGGAADLMRNHGFRIIVEARVQLRMAGASPRERKDAGDRRLVYAR